MGIPEPKNIIDNAKAIWSIRGALMMIAPFVTAFLICWEVSSPDWPAWAAPWLASVTVVSAITSIITSYCLALRIQREGTAKEKEALSKLRGKNEKELSALRAEHPMRDGLVLYHFKEPEVRRDVRGWMVAAHLTLENRTSQGVTVDLNGLRLVADGVQAEETGFDLPRGVVELNPKSTKDMELSARMPLRSKQVQPQSIQVVKVYVNGHVQVVSKEEPTCVTLPGKGGDVVRLVEVGE